MCGILGYIGNSEFSETIVNSTLNLMKSRGPNSQDFFKTKISHKHLFFLHSWRHSPAHSISHYFIPFFVDPYPRLGLRFSIRIGFGGGALIWHFLYIIKLPIPFCIRWRRCNIVCITIQLSF